MFKGAYAASSAGQPQKRQRNNHFRPSPEPLFRHPKANPECDDDDEDENGSGGDDDLQGVSNEEAANLGRMSPTSRRRYQSRMSSARHRERQHKRIISTTDDVRRLENHIASVQQSIYAYRTQPSLQSSVVWSSSRQTDGIDDIPLVVYSNPELPVVVAPFHHQPSQTVQTAISFVAGDCSSKTNDKPPYCKEVDDRMPPKQPMDVRNSDLAVIRDLKGTVVPADMDSGRMQDTMCLLRGELARLQQCALHMRGVKQELERIVRTITQHTPHCSVERQLVQHLDPSSAWSQTDVGQSLLAGDCPVSRLVIPAASQLAAGPMSPSSAPPDSASSALSRIAISSLVASNDIASIYSGKSAREKSGVKKVPPSP